jgi:hypothetical protein
MRGFGNLRVCSESSLLVQYPASHNNAVFKSQCTFYCVPQHFSCHVLFRPARALCAKQLSVLVHLRSTLEARRSAFIVHNCTILTGT